MLESRDRRGRFLKGVTPKTAFKKGLIPWNKSFTTVKCLSCGEEFHPHPYEIKLGYGKYCSHKCYSKSLIGKQPWNTGLSSEKQSRWKGGVTPILERLRKSREVRIWRNAVLERDGYRCIWCGSKSQLQADHIKPFRFYPELRLAIDNGRTLCQKCHITTSTYGNTKNNG